MTDVTHILNAIEEEDTGAADQMLPLAYEELRHLATQKMSRKNPGQTLQATALVLEAYIRLVGSEAQSRRSRTYFYPAAADAMHHILTENARRWRRSQGTRSGTIWSTSGAVWRRCFCLQSRWADGVARR